MTFQLSAPLKPGTCADTSQSSQFSEGSASTVPEPPGERNVKANLGLVSSCSHVGFRSVSLTILAFSGEGERGRSEALLSA